MTQQELQRWLDAAKPGETVVVPPSAGVITVIGTIRVPPSVGLTGAHLRVCDDDQP